MWCRGRCHIITFLVLDTLFFIPQKGSESHPVWGMTQTLIGV